jgi:hypothetical protein
VGKSQNRLRFLLLLVLLFACLFIHTPPDPLPVAIAAEPPSFVYVRGLVTTYCSKCHGEKVQKGGVNLAVFPDEKSVLRQRKVWREVAEQLKSGTMPPEGQKPLPKDQRDQMVAWITRTLDLADERDRTRPDPGRSVVRRLTRSEYNRTVRDLVGVDFDVSGAVGMPDDTGGDSFDNLAAALNVSDTLMEKYFAAADLILEKLYETARPRGEKPKPGTPPTAFERVVSVSPSWVMPPRVAAKWVVERLARRAYRRPVEAREVDRLLTLFDRASTAGMGYREALRPVLKAVLVSPNFLLRIERDRATDPDSPYRVSDHELATRLSYFLWSSMPDAELIALADRSELSRPEVFEKQVRRMLADPKARALTDDFAAQWLRLRKLADARPSTEFFPTFTPALRQAMYDEAATFFDKLRVDDRPITDLLDANYTYVNDELASHYGIKGVSGHEMRRVSLTDPNRGGLLGMGAALALTSHTNRTSPTLRGKYILDVILGTPPPPPPPDVGQIDDSKKGKDAKTFRELLTTHATRPACAGCHAKIDPLGFGLENFDAVGRYRKSGPDVDATGKLPTGAAFDGPKALKQVLLGRKDRFVENMTERLLSYALGRELQAADATTVKVVVADLGKNGERFSVLVLGIVKSYPFQHRRNLKADDGP